MIPQPTAPPAASAQRQKPAPEEPEATVRAPSDLPIEPVTEASILIGEAQRLVDQRKFEDAKRKLLQVNLHAQDDPIASFYLGLLAATIDKTPSDARRYFTRARQSDSTDPACLNNLALVAVRMGDPAQAEKRGVRSATPDGSTTDHDTAEPVSLPSPAPPGGICLEKKRRQCRFAGDCLSAWRVSANPQVQAKIAAVAIVDSHALRGGILLQEDFRTSGQVAAFLLQPDPDHRTQAFVVFEDCEAAQDPLDTAAVQHHGNPLSVVHREFHVVFLDWPWPPGVPTPPTPGAFTVVVDPVAPKNAFVSDTS